MQKIMFNDKCFLTDLTLEGIKHWRSIGCTEFDTPRVAFAVLIDRTSGKGTWRSNPFVFVYEYTLIK